MKTSLPNGHTGQMRAPNLRLRNSETIVGPLQVALINHREGAELGYSAGEEAYKNFTHEYGPIGYLAISDLTKVMEAYLSAPRYRPRQLTQLIVQEWKAMFLLAWTAQIMSETSILAPAGGEDNG